MADTKKEEELTAVAESVQEVEDKLDMLLGENSVLDLDEQRALLIEVRDSVLLRLDEVTDTLITELSGTPVDDDDTDDDTDDESEG